MRAQEIQNLKNLFRQKSLLYQQRKRDYEAAMNKVIYDYNERFQTLDFSISQLQLQCDHKLPNKATAIQDGKCSICKDRGLNATN